MCSTVPCALCPPAQVPPYTDDSLAEESSQEVACATGSAIPDCQSDALHAELQTKQGQVGRMAGRNAL